MTGGTPTFQAPWQNPYLFPPATLKDGRYGIWAEGSIHPVSLESILNDLRTNQEEKKGDSSSGWYEVPGCERVVLWTEIPQAQAVVSPLIEASLSKTLKTQGWIAWLGGPFVLGAGILGNNLGYLAFQVINSGEAWWESIHARRLLRSHPARFFATLTEQGRFEFWVSRIHWYRLWRTYGCAAVFLLLFGAQAFTGVESSVAQAGLVKPDVWAGQVWRLFTAAFLHGSLMHLLMNGFAWISLGTMIERVVHPGIVLPLFLSTAVAGNLASCLLLPDKPSLGASGGIMGILGFLTILGYRRKQLLPPGFAKSLVRNFAFMVAFGVMAWRVIDNAAHAGGYLAGLGIGYMAFRAPEGPLPLIDRRLLKWMDSLAILVAAFTTVWIGTRLSPK